MLHKKTPAAQLNREIAEVLARRTSSERTLYEDLVAAGIPTDSHESDLYVLDTPEARALLAKHGKQGSGFVSQIDRRRWLDVPFAYDPFWTKKARSHSVVKVSSSDKPTPWKKEHKTSGATVIERHAYGCELVVIPVSWSEPSGPAIWSVTCGSPRQSNFDLKKGRAMTVKGAKDLAMRAAKAMKH